MSRKGEIFVSACNPVPRVFSRSLGKQGPRYEVSERVGFTCSVDRSFLRLNNHDPVRYYKSSGFHDELALAAVFMYKATNETTYLTAAKSYYSAAASKLRKKTSFAYSWDDKLSAVALLLMEISNTSNTVYEQALRRKFTFWFPDCVGRKCDPGKDEGYGDNGCQCVFYTEDGLAVRDNWGSLASANNAAFIAHQFAAFLRKRNPADAYAKKLVDWSIRQTNYVLGDNKVSYSYMVGFGDPSRYCQYPLHISSFNSWIDFPLEGRTPYAIQQNFTVQGYSQPGEPKWEGPEYRIKQRFIVYGGILAGPYWYTSEPICDHWRFQFTEPAQDYTAAFLGAALPLVDIYGIRKKASDCGLDLGGFVFVPSSPSFKLTCQLLSRLVSPKCAKGEAIP